MAYNIRRYSKSMKLYRFYENGIRYTCEAKTLNEARDKFKACKANMPAAFKRGNRTTPRAKRKMPAVAPVHSLDMLNAFDVGVMLAHAGFDTVPNKVLKAFVTYAECKAARFGLHSI